MKNTERHDDFFKHHFNHKEVVRDFLKGRLPKPLLEFLDLNFLEKKEDSFLPNKYRNKRQADLIWAVKTKNERDDILFFFHFEGQSNIDKLMAIRLLEYHTSIARSMLQAGYQKCPPIFSFVIYHGKGDWTHATSIADIFSHIELYFKYGLQKSFLIEPAKESKEKLKRDGLAFCAELVLAKQPTGEMKGVVKEVIEQLAKASACCVEETYTYMMDYNREGEEEMLEEIRKFDPEESEKYRDMFERAIQRETKRIERELQKNAREELKEATRKVKMQALIEGKLDIAKQMLAKGMERKLISEVTGLSIKEIGELA